jgi:hypothetical protein
MKRAFFWFFVLGALNWAALHDILKGESNVWFEWIFVGVSVLLLVVYLFRQLRRLQN